MLKSNKNVNSGKSLGKKHQEEEAEVDESEETANASENDEEETEQDEEQEEDILIMKSGNKDHTRLPEGVCHGKILAVTAKKVEGEYGKYTRVEVTLKAKNPETKEIYQMKFFAGAHSARMFNFVEGVIGEEPKDDFNLKNLVD